MPTPEEVTRWRYRLAHMLDKPGILPHCGEALVFSFIIRTARDKCALDLRTVAQATYATVSVSMLEAVANEEEVTIMPTICVDIVRHGIRPLLTEPENSTASIERYETRMARLMLKEYLEHDTYFPELIQNDTQFTELLHVVVNTCKLDTYDLAMKSPIRSSPRPPSLSSKHVEGWARGERLLPKKYRTRFFTEAVLPVLLEALEKS